MPSVDDMDNKEFTLSSATRMHMKFKISEVIPFTSGGRQDDTFHPGHLLDSEYEGDENSLPLEGCLENARQRIRHQYLARIYPRTGVEFEVFWEGIRLVQHRPPPGNQTRLYIDYAGASLPVGPEAHAALYIAGLFFYNALREYQNDKFERSWAALLRCYFYLGMSSGPTSAKEHSAATGRTSSAGLREFTDDLRENVIQWLSELPDHAFDFIEEVIQEILPAAVAYQTMRTTAYKKVNDGKAEPWSSVEPKKILRKWSGKKYPVVRGLMISKVNPDRRKGSGHPIVAVDAP